MTSGPDDDVATLAAISRELAAIDVDAPSAERIARRAREDVGRGPPPTRWIEPMIAAVITGSYLVWGVIKVLEALG